MSESSLRTMRFTFRRRSRATSAVVHGNNHDVAHPVSEHVTATAQFELITSLRGVRPERVQAICDGTAPTHGSGLSLGLAVEGLSQMLRRH